MKIPSPLILILLFSCQSIYAQNSPAGTFEIVSITSLRDTIPERYVQIVTDKSASKSLDEIRSKWISDNRIANPSGAIDFKTPTYWINFNIANRSDSTLQISFYDENKAYSDWYMVDSIGNYIHKVSGNLLRWSQNQGYTLNNYALPDRFVAFEIAPHTEVAFYNRIRFNFLNYNATLPKNLVVPYGSTSQMITSYYIKDESRYFRAFLNAFLFGITILAALYSTIFYIITRSKTYLYFALFSFSLGFGRINIYAEFYHIFLREYPYAYLSISLFIWPFTTLFLALFILSFLNTKRNLPIWDDYIRRLTLFVFISSLLIPIIEYALRGTSIWGVYRIIPNVGYFILQFCLSMILIKSIQKFPVDDRRTLLAIIPAIVIWLIGSNTFALFADLLFVFHVPATGLYLWLTQHWHFIEFICICWLVFCFSWILFQNFVVLKHENIKKDLDREMERNQLINLLNVELEEKVKARTSDLTQSLNVLKSTQSQLIQSEKMASLGELTAGIAHEIQNPLNFVNNFSEINTELSDEIVKAVANGNFEEVKAIATDIKKNQEKINEHGKRADSIVKSMLQHSRSSAGIKEPTDLNALADEYLRLAYHGIRAKDKTFNVTIKTNFDPNLPLVPLVAQDISRVLLNLFNNAFYAVNEKAKTAGDAYQPIVTVATELQHPEYGIRNTELPNAESANAQMRNAIILTVRDNGNGIPDSIKDKIFQPFFTTKPTGQGTGLGLSLSYDIVKAHGGEIQVGSTSEDGTVIQILLPMQNFNPVNANTSTNM